MKLKKRSPTTKTLNSLNKLQHGNTLSMHFGPSSTRARARVQERTDGQKEASLGRARRRVHRTILKGHLRGDLRGIARALPWVSLVVLSSVGIVAKWATLRGSVQKSQAYLSDRQTT